MNKNIKHFVLVIVTVLALGLFAGCGPAKPTADDATKYVQAVLDVLCTGDYDHSVELADVEEGKESELRDSLIKEFLDDFASEQGLSDDVKADFQKFMTSAFEKAKYTVGEATATDDGGFDVTVSVEPLAAFNGVADKLQSAIDEKATQDPDSLLSMSEEELNNYIIKLAVGIMNENLENPKYDDPVDVTLHYGLIDEENNIYGCTEEEGKKVGEKLFSLEGLE